MARRTAIIASREAAAARSAACAGLSPRRAAVIALASAALAWRGGAAPLFAEGADSGIELDEVEVTATRIPERAADAPQATWTVTAEDIEARGAATVADAVRVAAGVTLSDAGPEGAKKAVSIRGSTTNQVLVLVDGQRVNDALSGLADLSLIPAERIERIEVVRGSGSALYGGDAVGGVVNVITKRGAAPLVVKFENSSYVPERRYLGFSGLGTKREAEPDPADLVDAQRLSLSGAEAMGDAVLRFGGSFVRAANAYTYTDSSSERRGLENAGTLAGDASLGVDLPFLAGGLSLDLAGSLDKKGSPGTMTDPNLDATQADASASLAARYAADTSFSDLASLDVSTRAAWSRLDYEDADAPENDGLHDLASASLEIGQRYLASDSVAVAYGLSGSYARSWSDTVGNQERWTGAAYVEPAFGSGALSFRPALRYDWYSDFSPGEPWGGLAGSLGVAYAFGPDGTLKLSLARAYRVPTFNDLYWPERDGAAGNPDLAPESAYEANLSYELKADRLSYVACLYLRYSRDVILWQPDAGGTWRPTNYGAALYPGLEQGLRAELGSGWSIAANYSFLRSTALSGGLSLADDKRLPMTPVHTLNATLARGGERLDWSATARYVGLRYLKLANTASLPAYFTLDLAAKWRASARYAPYVAVDNLFGEEYEVVEGYPMPGTRVRVGIELTLK